MHKSWQHPVLPHGSTQCCHFMCNISKCFRGFRFSHCQAIFNMSKLSWFICASLSIVLFVPCWNHGIFLGFGYSRHQTYVMLTQLLRVYCVEASISVCVVTVLLFVGVVFLCSGLVNNITYDSGSKSISCIIDNSWEFPVLTSNILIEAIKTD